jgi:hypothetical protein
MKSNAKKLVAQELQRNPAQSNLVGIAVAAILAGIPLTFPASAQAQEKSAPPDLEEVTVTGSRIVRRDLV